MKDNSRRQFISRYFLHQVGQCISGFEKGVDEIRKEDDFEKFFESDESSYALTLAYPDEILLATAKNHGIDIDGRSKRDIIKELILKREDY